MTRRAPRAQRARRGRRGFTLIEVMVSLGIMTIGAMTMIALQQHTIRSNSHARELTTAMQIAQLWIERLKQDAHTWNVPNETGVDNTFYLNAVRNSPGVFVPFPNDEDNVELPPEEGSRVFDFRGTPILQVQGGTLGPEDVFYCASYRTNWVYRGRALRVDVRVWWPRAGSGRQPSEDFDNWCEDDNAALNPGGDFFNDFSYHVVYLSTVVRPEAVLR